MDRKEREDRASAKFQEFKDRDRNDNNRGTPECALCQMTVSVTIAGGFAVCVICRDAVMSTFKNAAMLNAVRLWYSRVGLRFGPLEWQASFKKEVLREERQQKKSEKAANAREG